VANIATQRTALFSKNDFTFFKTNHGIQILYQHSSLKTVASLLYQYGDMHTTTTVRETA
jgi:hypothetical protein